MTPRTPRAVGCILLSAAVLTCGKTGGSAPTASTLTLASGNGQSGPAGGTLPNPLVVRVSDSGGNPVGSVTVTWASTSGGGNVASPNTVTTADGTASTGATLGPIAGANVFTATATGLSGSPVTFTETAV